MREVEPRTVMWAVAEVFWEDATGTSNHVAATMEDTSLSGACVRVKRSFDVGSRVMIRWHREQFAAIAKNCRTDGRDFLLGVRREAGRNCLLPGLPSPSEVKPVTRPLLETTRVGTTNLPVPAGARSGNIAAKPEIESRSASVPLTKPAESPATRPSNDLQDQASAPALIAGRSVLSAARSPESVQQQGSSSRHERKVMASKSVFPKFWGRKQDEDAPRHATHKEAPVNLSSSKASAAEPITAPARDLLSYDDIYHAAGIMAPRSGYGIPKVVEMLNSQRIRDLSSDIKRASVLMALDVAGTSVDEVLQDATRRQQALDAYETAQRKQLEVFEAQKSKENAEIEAEMERIRAHYAQRIQNNLDHVAREKEALHNWQMAMQHESQRIAEVIELCRNQPVATAAASPQSPSNTVPSVAKGSSAHA